MMATGFAQAAVRAWPPGGITILPPPDMADPWDRHRVTSWQDVADVLRAAFGES